MKLLDLLRDVEFKDSKGSMDRQISDVVTDSRKAKDDALFIAVCGVQVDGHAYVDNAISHGAKVIVYQNDIDTSNSQITYIKVSDTTSAVGKIANVWYGDPSDKIKLVGVTGTNGKTTVATVLYNLFRKLGYKTGLLSTVANYVDDKMYPATLTTPDALTINRYLHDMVKAGCEYAFMEVSSHSIHQQRIEGLKFDGGIFTNLTQDHLDYHGSMGEYLKAKKLFFDNLPSTAFALTNIDDKNGAIMLQNTKASKHTYSVKGMADFKARIVEKHFDGTAIEINNKEVQLQFVGIFNVYNLLAVYGTAILLRQSVEDVLLTMSTLRPVSGRFQTFKSPLGYTAIVDYAHTPDALTNVLNAIHEVLEGNGRVITVVGCGGNRDRTKRPIMAQEAAKLSDQLIVTSDNPRYEEPMAIINDMIDGLQREQMQSTLLLEDRKQAIRTACTLAKEGDIILIAGKGHEDYQDIKGVKYPFSDKEIILEFFNDQK